MREHKYRIWDAENKEFIYFNLRRLVGHWDEAIFDPEEPTTQDNGVGLAGLNGGDGLLAHGALDEFTGLKDGEGQEIYEHDIIGTYPDGAPGNNRIVIIPECYEWTLNGNLTARWIVVGNIYQNPELLEKKGSFTMPGLLPRNITIIGSGSETSLTYFGAEDGQESIGVSGLEIRPSIKDEK